MDIKRKPLTIGDLARATDEDVHAIRFWMQEGLLSAIGETEGGYQLFTDETVQRVKRIRELKDTGFYTLKGIKDILEKETK
jgi:DNA-binding transcriptional MerR regulator